jgi:hypothetical protein
MSPIPARVMAADQKDLKPSIGRVIRLIARVVLLHDIVQVLYLAEFDAGFIVGVVLFYRRGVGPALVDGDLLRHTALVDGFAEEAAAALRSRLAVRRKSTVCPALSTARWRVARRGCPRLAPEEPSVM